MTKLIFTIGFILLLLGAGFYFGILYKTMHPDIAEQPLPTPAEKWEVPAKVTTEEIIAKHITVYDTVLVKQPIPTLSRQYVGIPEQLASRRVRKDPIATNLTVATFPLRFSREGASFQADITYRYSDKTFVIENPYFTAPKAKVIYKDKLFKFGSACGLLTDSEEYSAYFQPVIVSVWRFDIYPTILISDKVSYGLGVGIGW